MADSQPHSNIPVANSQPDSNVPVADSQPNSNIFSVRIVSIDYYMAPPIPDLDICYSRFQGGKVNEVPVIRIYGSTPVGQKTCLHVHRVLPYLYVPCTDIPFQPDQEGDAYTNAISLAIEKALKLKGTAGSTRQHVHGCSLVRAKRFYGYHSSEELFIKIHLYYPHDVSRAARLLLGGAVLDKSLQPHESHIPYILQFLIDYNLYGMGHLHLSKVKFRQPVPDVFSPMRFSYNGQYRQKMDKLTGLSADFQADSSGDACLGSQVWISTTIPGDWMWQFSNEFDTSSDQGIHSVKRQSVCELEGDVTIDEVINQHLKMYTSLSQSRSDVKMVQSLIPIWEEEYERTGMHESAIPPDPSKPVPEDVLKTLLLGLESKNKFMELCGEGLTDRTLIPSDSDMKFVQAITYLTDEENLAELGHAKNIGGESLKCSKEREIIGSLSPRGSVYEKEIGAIPFDGKDACLKLLSGDEIRSSEMIETENRKPADKEALGLLRWFATTQAADDINSDDELVCETILSPLLPATTIEKVLEKANVDYENESQKECQDILDSNEDLIDFEGLRERATRSTDHGCHPQTSSERKIPQVDGSCDDLYSSPFAGPAGNSSNIKMKSESKRLEKQVLQDIGSSFTSKQRRNKSGWGSLPFCMNQRENDDLQTVSCDITGAGATDSKDHVGMSFSAGSEVGKCFDALTMNAEKDFCDLKETGMLVGCSVRDLMRRKRCHRVEPPECGSHRVKKILLDGEERDDVFLCAKRLDFNSLYNDGHDLKAFGSFTGQQVEHHEACDVKPTNYGCTMNNRLALSSSNDSSLQASAPSVENICSFEKIDDEVGLGAIARSANIKITSPRSVHREKKRLICNFNPENQDSAVPMDFNGEGSDSGATYVKTRTSDLCTSKSNSKFDARLLKFDTEGKPLADEKLPQTDSAASSCLSTYPHEGEMFAGDSCLHKCGHKDRTSMVRVHEMSNENLVGTVTTTDTTVLQNDDCGGGEQGGDIGRCRSPSMVVNMEAKPADLIGMTLCKKPSAADWKDGRSKNISHLPAIFNCHSLINEENCEGKALDEILPFFVDACQEDEEVLKNCLRSSDSDFHQEDIMGVPTHYQNDGSYLYLLTPVFSPPSADCVNRWLLHDNEGTSGEISRVSVEPPFLKSSFNQVHQEKDGNPNATSRGEVKAILQGEGKTARVITCTDCTHDISQFSGPDERSRPTPLSQIGFRDPASVGGGQQLTLLSIEVQVGSRENLRPDPRFDAINVVALAVQNDNDSIVEVYVLLRSTESNRRSLDGISSFKLFIFSEEKHLFSHFVNIVYSLDPDILMGWDIQGGSLGFLAERASHLGIGLLNKISRTPLETKIAAGDSEIADEGMPDNMLPEHLVSGSVLIENAIIEDEWGRTHASGVHVGGRVVLNVWRLMRGEVKLNMYTVEAVAEAVLRRKVPSIHYKVLTNWFSSGPGRARYRCIEYVIERAKLNLEIMNQLDMINRTSELARVFGIDFFSVLSRGSQYRVESMFLRLAHTQNYLAISPGNQQVASQPAMECLPLVMEPESGFYSDPVVVLDFQSLYPSMIIAYNLCFCTCLGNVAPSKANTLGVLSFSPEPHFLRNLKDQILLTPNGVMYVPSKVRKGILPRLLEEILSTRVMVKRAMKKLAPSQQVLHRIFNARQLALKLIANVTYGYTAAGFSGRMPCAELADSIVQCGRSTLERAISFVNANEKWKAKVIYGDTDSMFVLLKGRTVKESFQIGHEIAAAITAMNPNPVTLKMEKVYHPCFLLTKKRYVGYSYEGPDQIEPVFDAKGIETVRRDTCRAVAKTMEQSLRLFFKHQNLFEIKAYLQRQWTRILSGRVSVQDFVFAKEVRLGTYLTKSSSSLPPAAIVAAKAMRADPRAEPRYAERVPYVVIHGEPGARLVDMVVDPLDLLAIASPFRLNDLYYINKQIIPALQRVFGLVGADLNRWFSEMPRPVREAFAKLPLYAPNPQRARIDFYYLSKHCIVCGEMVQSSAHLCNKCSHKGIVSAAAVIGRTSKLEREMQHISAICRHCGGGDWLVESGVKCTSLACSVFYERRKVQKELQGLSAVAADAGFYPKCMVEWF